MNTVIRVGNNMPVKDTTWIDSEVCAEGARAAYFAAAQTEDLAAKAQFTSLADMCVEIGEVAKRRSSPA